MTIGKPAALALTILTGLVVGVGATFLIQTSSADSFLASPTLRQPVTHDIDGSYEPLHKGHVDVGTGLYIRRDEDLILRKTPGFALTRTYLSGDRVSRRFGIGTMHNGEWYLTGDASAFSWAEVILADRASVHFDRRSPGTKYWDALFEARQSPTEFLGSRLGWSGHDWVLRFEDGALARFLPCGAPHTTCAITLLRDADNHVTTFERDRGGRLLRVRTLQESVTFTYDDHDRITHVVDGLGHGVDYTYDAGGRLTQVTEANRVIRTYTYSALDEMLTILEPGWYIENTFEGGRLVRQVTVTAGPPLDTREPKAFILQLAYTVANDSVTETRIREYDGTTTVLRFDESHYLTVEMIDADGASPIIVQYDRDPAAHYVRSLTVRCTVRGRHVTRTEPVTGRERETKDALIAGACAAPDFRRPPAEQPYVVRTHLQIGSR